MNLGDKPAFPVDMDATNYDPACDGMTYRQWLVGMALQGIMANQHSYEEMTLDQQGLHAIEMADNVIARLEPLP